MRAPAEGFGYVVVRTDPASGLLSIEHVNGDLAAVRERAAALGLADPAARFDVLQRLDGGQAGLTFKWDKP